MKSLPLSEVEVVAVLELAELEDMEGHTRPVFETEVLNPALYEAAAFRPFDGTCQCCGRAVKYVCQAVHKPTLTGYTIGRQCAASVDALQEFMAAHAAEVRQASVALSQRIACRRREAAVRAVHPEAAALLDWAAGTRNRIAADIHDKARAFGSLSDVQIGLLRKLKAQEEERASLTVSCPAGRVTVEGRIVSRRVLATRYGDTVKAVIETADRIRLYGSLPAVLAEVPVGETVRFCAEVTPSGDDRTFGFFSRPTKAVRRPSALAA